MERLDLLEKIYLFGETLSSEEMNLIVSHINNVIDAVNTIIRNNNGVNAGHCEMRYILSSSLPTKPETGTNGFANGWTNLYVLPEAESGNSTWMSMCFVSGENSYGEWSTPICLSSGTVTGLLGPKGDSGLAGAFVSRVFKRQNTKPDRPTGGTYAHPYPLEQGWSDGIPNDSNAIIWSSTCTFYGNGTLTGWSEPAQESDTATLDIEFSPNLEKPLPPMGSRPFSNHEAEGWYDPNSQNFSSVGPMIWRAERKVSNGEYDGEWTITRIFGEQGISGNNGLDGGHYEFRYQNFKATANLRAPIKPAEGTDGTSGGWSISQPDLTELEIKEGTFTWMTLCYFNEHGEYGIWTDPIRITGANGIDGEDGTELEFMYTRNNTGDIPDTPPQTLKNEAALFNELGEWTDPISGITWTDDPRGVSDVMMWEFVTTRVKEGTIWGPFSTPVIWAKWGKQGKIGLMSYLAGVWKSDVTYKKTAERCPVVYHENPNDHTFDYYYLAGDINSLVTEISSIGDSPTGSYTSENPNPWAKAENFKMVFTDILFVQQFAKLLSFIISYDWMFSQYGTLYDAQGGAHEIAENGWNGHTINDAYTYFQPDSPSENKSGVLNFVPDFAIDALSGRCFFWKGYFKGDVYANSLHLGNTDLTLLPTTINNMSAEVSRKLGKLVGSNFNVNDSGILTAHNAVIDGNIMATDGYFIGDVYANTFTAGNSATFNVEVTNNSINFKYGDQKRAWFTTDKLVDNGSGGYSVDNSVSNVGGFYLYMISPKDGSLITIDFADLTFKRVVSGGSIHSKILKVIKRQGDSSYTTYLDIENKTVYYDNNNLYYSNSEGTATLSTYDLNNTYEVLSSTGYGAYYLNNRYVMYSLSLYRKVVVENGTLVRDTSAGYVCSLHVCLNNGVWKDICVKPSAYQTTFYNYNTSMSKDGLTLDLTNGPKFPGGSSSGYSVVDYTGSSILTTSSGTYFTVTGDLYSINLMPNSF